MPLPDMEYGQGQRPGDILLNELKAQDMTQADLATLMGRSPQYVNDIVKNKKRIDSIVAMELHEALGTLKPTEWLEADLRYQQAQQKSEEGALRRKDVMEKYPFALEAVRYGWIPDSRNPQELQDHIEQFLAPQVSQTIATHHFRQADYASVETSLRAWHIRVFQKAVENADPDFPAYLPKNNELLLSELRGCMREEGDVVKVKDILKRYGIRFVIVSHLKKAPVDGVASYNGGKPYIGLSLRNGQFDRFWFTLMHELAHIIFMHSEKDYVRADNIDERGQKHEYEIQADDFASQKMLSEDRFSAFALAGNHTLLDIQAFAQAENVHPSIVIGRLKHTGWLTWSDFARAHPSVRDDFAGMIEK